MGKVRLPPHHRTPKKKKFEVFEMSSLSTRIVSISMKEFTSILFIDIIIFRQLFVCFTKIELLADNGTVYMRNAVASPNI